MRRKEIAELARQEQPQCALAVRASDAAVTARQLSQHVRPHSVPARVRERRICGGSVALSRHCQGTRCLWRVRERTSAAQDGSARVPASAPGHEVCHGVRGGPAGIGLLSMYTPPTGL